MSRKGFLVAMMNTQLLMLSMNALPRHLFRVPLGVDCALFVFRHLLLAHMYTLPFSPLETFISDSELTTH